MSPPSRSTQDRTCVHEFCPVTLSSPSVARWMSGVGLWACSHTLSRLIEVDGFCRVRTRSPKCTFRCQMESKAAAPCVVQTMLPASDYVTDAVVFSSSEIHPGALPPPPTSTHRSIISTYVWVKKGRGRKSLFLSKFLGENSPGGACGPCDVIVGLYDVTLTLSIALEGVVSILGLKLLLVFTQKWAKLLKNFCAEIEGRRKTFYSRLVEVDGN